MLGARHDDHEVGIILRYHKGNPMPVPGLYCLKCVKLIKWTTLIEAEELLASGVEDLGMMPAEEAIWRRETGQK